MSEDTGPKSSFELAMERLKKRDAEAGIERKPVTDAQKAEIAEIRRVYEAKLAELDLQRQGKQTLMIDPLQVATEAEEYRRERDRLITERDRKVETVRG
jgi:hypothetical protein